MARIAKNMAADPSHGYSQRPPNGRWGPDYDCSSFIYTVAHAAGYDVGIGGGEVRYTGTLLEDFKKAGFQILPFANVGLGDLEVGDILLNLALHAEIYVGEGQVVGAQGSEDGGFNGEAGDQTGQEIVKQPVYELDKGWDYVVKPPRDDEEDENGESNETESSLQDGEGAEEMPSYSAGNQMNGGWQGRNSGWNPAGGQYNGYAQGSGYPQGGYGAYGPNNGYGAYGPNNGYGNSGYPQGNMGQMNGYSQANAGGYQQGRQQLTQVHGIEEAKDVYVAPGSTMPMFDWNKYMLFIKSADQEGIPTLRAFRLEECSEEFPQHHGGENYGGQYVSRHEFEELKEMIGDVRSALSGAAGFPQGNKANGSNSANAGEHGYAQGNNADSKQQSNGRSARNS